jgi:protein TonB
MISHAPAYGLQRRAGAGQRAAAWTAIALLHVAALVWFMHQRVEPHVTPLQHTLDVSFVRERQPAPLDLPDAPRPVIRPEPRPRMVSTPQPSPAAMVAPPEPVAAIPEPAAPPPAATPTTAPAQVTAPDYEAAYLNNPGPAYPMVSRRRREEGLVRLKVLVSAGGEPEQVQVDTSSGHAELDIAAADIVRKRWRFVPAREGERVVAAWVIVPISFQLKNR